MLEQGLIARLVDLTKSDDRGLRLNALWGFKNLLHKSSPALKQTVMTALGWDTLSRYHISHCVRVIVRLTSLQLVG